MAVYPTAFWGGNTRGANLNDAHTHTKWHDDIMAEVIAMQAELGLQPKGGFSSVKARLDAAISIAVFTANGTWTKPAGASKVFVRGVGGGGGAGGAAITAAAQGALGGGGGGGQYREGWFAASTFAATQAVVIGGGGNGGSGTTDGAAGGNTTFAGLTIIGGSGGTGSPATAVGISAAGGVGGAGGAGGSIAINGERGCHPQVMTGGIPVPSSSNGGDSQLGYGARGPATATGGTGANGGLYGGGGSGAVNGPSQGTAKVGGNGADGILIVVTFF